jgi:hypothetical protein
VGGKQVSKLVISVVPVDGDWSKHYKAKAEEMIEAKKSIKRTMLRHGRFEAAFNLPTTKHIETFYDIKGSFPKSGGGP